MIKHQLFIGAALLIGVAVGYFVRETHPVVSGEAATLSPHEARLTIADKGPEATIAALRARLDELEAAAALPNSNLIAVSTGESHSNSVRETASAGDDRRRRREWLERMKKDEPERYAEMTNRWSNFRAERKAEHRTRLDMISSVDTSRMSAAAKENHERYQELMVRRDELEDRMHAAFANDGITEDQRQEMFREMGDLSRELAEASREERMNLLGEMTKSLGFEGEDVTEITETISDIIEATEQFGFRGHGPGRGGRGPGPVYGGQGGRR